MVALILIAACNSSDVQPDAFQFTDAQTLWFDAAWEAYARCSGWPSGTPDRCHPECVNYQDLGKQIWGEANTCVYYVETSDQPHLCSRTNMTGPYQMVGAGCCVPSPGRVEFHVCPQ